MSIWNVRKEVPSIIVVNFSADKRKFITDRLEGFDTLEKKLNALIPLLQAAKHDTMDYYRENPNSFSVVYGTDLANDYLNDLIDLFKKQ